MGYLCEFLDQYIDKQLNQEQIGKILHSMICNISQDQGGNNQEIELTGIAIKALQRTIPSTGLNF